MVGEETYAETNIPLFAHTFETSLDEAGLTRQELNVDREMVRRRLADGKYDLPEGVRLLLSTSSHPELKSVNVSQNPHRLLVEVLQFDNSGPAVCDG